MANWHDTVPGDLSKNIEPPKADSRPVIYVHTDHNPDEVRCLYEIPDALARLIQPEGDPRTFAQALADLCGGSGV